MNKSQVVKTPIGRITIEPNSTPSSNATTSIGKVKTELYKLANSGTVPFDKIRNDRNDNEPDNY